MKTRVRRIRSDQADYYSDPRSFCGFFPPIHADISSHESWEPVLTEDLGRLTPSNARPGRSGRFVFVSDSLTDEVDECFLVEADGPGRLRSVLFAPGETDEGLDGVKPVVVEGYLVMLRHKASGQFSELIELEVRHVRRVR